LTLHALWRIGRQLEAIPELIREREDAFRAFVTIEKSPSAAEGAETVALAFDALACTGKDPYREGTAASVLKQIAARQQPDGRFLDRTASDNPEPLWYHELALLHAVTTYAYHSGDRPTREAALRAAAYQADQIQPDHASSHPFAMHAFLRSSDGTYLADMMLHSAGVQSPATMDTVSLLLLADALDCMRSSNWRE